MAAREGGISEQSTVMAGRAGKWQSWRKSRISGKRIAAARLRRANIALEISMALVMA